MESLSSSVARSVGLCGATQPAKTAQKMLASATAAAPIAIGELRNECQKSPSRKRAQRPGATTATDAAGGRSRREAVRPAPDAAASATSTSA